MGGDARLDGAKLRQDSVGGLWMEKCDKLAGGAVEGLFVDQADAVGRRLLQLAIDIIGPKRNMVDSLALVRDELGDGALRRGCLQEFEVDTAHVEKCGPDPLGGDFLTAQTAQPERGFVKWHGLIEGANGDAQMVNGLDHGERKIGTSTTELECTRILR